MKTEDPYLHTASRKRRWAACIIPRRTILPFIALSVVLACAAVFAGCVAAPSGEDVTTATSNVTTVEVIHFTTPNQCYSCVVLGDYAEETVRTHFADEIASGKMSFEHVSIADPAQQDIVERYGATGSSLWIGVYDDEGRFFPEEDLRVWYKLNDKPGFSAYLKTLLEMRLRGDLTR
ncbi:hypothetical protein AZH53_09470 [Methanomicrobiaceae archaeon CYW5]|uniref:nitrophenyl compound nitroreductase subunit ArsF family protein n=1 Tax=Methanovulcanius yangii TaxID=1789227 RepID=UPI0029CA0E25|nr:nitrophenyl compound nitroreductase subunit ArsF family protein [Methanovulcanius yangii]MBT8508632.1 hypothetical protein [Methanovulcanius yangii]